MANNMAVLIAENLNLLKLYKESDLVPQQVNELMSVPNKKILFSILFYIMDIVYENWREEVPIVFSKKEENQFLTIACKHFRQIGKEFPFVNLPLVTPSSLSGLYGEKFGQYFYKLTIGVMLMIMKKDNLECSESEEDLERDISELEQKIEGLSKDIEEKRAIKQSVMKKEREILEHIVNVGDWDEDVKERLLDLNDNEIVPECLQTLEYFENEKQKLMEEMEPYLFHIKYCSDKSQCCCESKYIVPPEVERHMRSLMMEQAKEYILYEIRDLKSRIAVRTILNEDDPSGASVQSEDYLQLMLEELESLVDDDDDDDADGADDTDDEDNQSSAVNVSAVNPDSPSVLENSSASPLCMDSLCEGYTPMLSSGTLKWKREPFQINVKPFLHRMSLTLPVDSEDLPPKPVLFLRNTIQKANEPKKLEDILERMQAKHASAQKVYPPRTPLLKMAHPPDGAEDCTSSTRIDEPFVTPFGMQGGAASANPRKLGIRRRLSTGSTCKKQKIAVNDKEIEVDNILDLIVKKMMATPDTNDSFSDGDWTPNQVVNSTQLSSSSPEQASQFEVTQIKVKKSAETSTHLWMDKMEEIFEQEDTRLSVLNKSANSNFQTLQNDIAVSSDDESEELATPLDIVDKEEEEAAVPQKDKSLQSIIARYVAYKNRMQN